MKYGILILLAFGLTGCEVCERHRGACAIAAGVAVTSLALCMSGNKREESKVVIITPNCANGACK